MSPAQADVALVIPARNAAGTLEACLRSAVPLLERELAEIILVDDGSSDDTAAIGERHAVRVLRGPGRGPGAARNLGWRAAESELIWFVDSDCEIRPDALPRLRAALGDEFAAAGGSYANARPHSLVATLIHEEIVDRHLAMPSEVDFLASFNVLYRRGVLDKVGGFDERFLKAQDAELAFRVRRAGERLAFDPRSQVAHFHDDGLLSYLRTQAKQGYWRAWLYAVHPQHMSGDSYSGRGDHLQPPLALVALALTALAALPVAGWAAIAAWLALLGLAWPLAARLVRRTRRPALWLHLPLGAVRALARGLGMAAGAAAVVRSRLVGTQA